VQGAGSQHQRLLRLPPADAKPRQQRREQIAEAAEAAYRDSHCIYGYRKVHDDLQEQKVKCCRETVRRVLREKGLLSRTKRKFVVTTDSRHQQPVAANVLDRDFQADAPDRKWTGDITYIATRQGWLYLAVVMDLFSRKIVGWATSSSLHATLVLDALGMALRRRMPGAGLVHHSDRGCQYAAADYQRLLADHGIVCSMSRKGNCWDNAPTESFFGKLKVEWVHGVEYADHEEAKRHLFEYIEVFYNRKRKHAALGYESPAAFEDMFNLHSLTEAA
jgi:transposase InsO family protein